MTGGGQISAADFKNKHSAVLISRRVDARKEATDDLNSLSPEQLELLARAAQDFPQEVDRAVDAAMKRELICKK